MSLDFAYTHSKEGPTEEEKEELRLYDGDLRGGISLLVTEDWMRSVMVLPVPAKGRAHVKYMAEQVDPEM